MFKIAFLAGLSVAAVVLAVASSVGPLGTGTKAEAQEAATFNSGVKGPPYEWLPSRVTVTTGTTVEWTVTGRAPHTGQAPMDCRSTQEPLTKLTRCFRL